ncbi:MAG: LPS assembly lipoprotein LptE [Gallionella sp.]
MRALLRKLILLITTALLVACSFHLRGQAGMPFNTLYLDAANPATPFIKELSRDLESNKVRIVDYAEQADMVLNIVFETFDKQILSLTSSGRVNEFQLFYRVSARAYDLNKRDWIPAEEFVMHRNYRYENNTVAAMEAEETLLYQSMRSDMAQQIVRRLSRAQLQPSK